MKQELKVSKIRHGTVIDHITAGMAPLVLRILGINQGFSDVVVVAMNVRSNRLGCKDVVKIENVVLSEKELQKISIIAPNAVVNIIDGFEVVEKREVSCPHELEGIVRCPNRNCISSDPTEKATTFFRCETHDPLRLRCHYCEVLIDSSQAEII